ncbi:unnamed protein product [Acanthosepion pharaonis]|uniref:Uncharacterized protein n=1 Tax=Acanthosepion pharaonis TaxID=158019 RepID=A0A812BMX3_ACAPH|nr:unnamed protein product [Sepia pharaonis]
MSRRRVHQSVPTPLFSPPDCTYFIIPATRLHPSLLLTLFRHQIVPLLHYSRHRLVPTPLFPPRLYLLHYSRHQIELFLPPDFTPLFANTYTIILTTMPNHPLFPPPSTLPPDCTTSIKIHYSRHQKFPPPDCPLFPLFTPPDCTYFIIPATRLTFIIPATGIHHYSRHQIVPTHYSRHRFVPTPLFLPPDCTYLIPATRLLHHYSRHQIYHSIIHATRTFCTHSIILTTSLYPLHYSHHQIAPTSLFPPPDCTYFIIPATRLHLLHYSRHQIATIRNYSRHHYSIIHATRFASLIHYSTPLLPPVPTPLFLPPDCIHYSRHQIVPTPLFPPPDCTYSIIPATGLYLHHYSRHQIVPTPLFTPPDWPTPLFPPLPSIIHATRFPLFPPPVYAFHYSYTTIIPATRLYLLHYSRHRLVPTPLFPPPDCTYFIIPATRLYLLHYSRHQIVPTPLFTPPDTIQFAPLFIFPPPACTYSIIHATRLFHYSATRFPATRLFLHYSRHRPPATRLYLHHYSPAPNPLFRHQLFIIIPPPDCNLQPLFPPPDCTCSIIPATGFTYSIIIASIIPPPDCTLLHYSRHQIVPTPLFPPPTYTPDCFHYYSIIPATKNYSRHQKLHYSRHRLVPTPLFTPPDCTYFIIPATRLYLLHYSRHRLVPTPLFPPPDCTYSIIPAITPLAPPDYPKIIPATRSIFRHPYPHHYSRHQIYSATGLYLIIPATRLIPLFRHQIDSRHRHIVPSIIPPPVCTTPLFPPPIVPYSINYHYYSTPLPDCTYSIIPATSLYLPLFPPPACTYSIIPATCTTIIHATSLFPPPDCTCSIIACTYTIIPATRLYLLHYSRQPTPLFPPPDCTYTIIVQFRHRLVPTPLFRHRFVPTSLFPPPDCTFYSIIPATGLYLLIIIPTPSRHQIELEFVPTPLFPPPACKIIPATRLYDSIIPATGLYLLHYSCFIIPDCTYSIIPAIVPLFPPPATGTYTIIPATRLYSIIPATHSIIPATRL